VHYLSRFWNKLGFGKEKKKGEAEAHLNGIIYLPSKSNSLSRNINKSSVFGIQQY